MKRLALILCIILIFCMPAQALTMGGGTANSGAISQIASMDKEIVLLEQDEELTEDLLLPAGPYLSAEGQPYLLPMQWNVAAEELTAPGLHLVSGIPVLEEGMTLAEGFDPTFTWPVFRIGDGAVLELESVDDSSLSDVLIGQGQDPLAALVPKTVVNNGQTAEGWKLDTKIRSDLYWQWDLSAVDPAVLGKYTVTAQLCHPQWAVLPEGYETTEKTVYVMPTDRIELYGAVRMSGNGALELSWIYDSVNVTEPILERKDETGQWMPCEESWYQVHISGMNVHDSLWLYLTEMPTEEALTLRLRYCDTVDGTDTERITEPITLTVPANIADLIAAADDGKVVVDVIGGDRDGGDSDGDDLPDYEQPSPKPDWGRPAWRPAGKDEGPEETVTEIVTDTYTALSGLRLKQLVGLGDTVLFEKQGISVEIPSALLDDLNLGDNELLEVTVERQKEHGVSVQVVADGEDLQYLGETTVRVPWDAADGTELELLDANGFVIGSAVYEAIGTAFFTIDRPGTYWIRAVVAVPPVVETQTVDTAAPSETAEIPDSTEEQPIHEAVAEEIPADQTPETETQVQKPAVTDPVEPEPEQPVEETPENRSSVWWIAIVIFPAAAIVLLLIRRWRHG